MNLDRRVVLAVASGAALVVVALTVSRLLVQDTDTGWFMVAGAEPTPLGDGVDNGDFVVVAIVWLVAVGVWLSYAWWLFRPRRA